MIHINFNIRNPWSNRFDNLKCWSEKVFENKAIEFEILKTTDIIDFSIDITHRQSHAGFRLELGLLGYNMSFHFYDTRHWDYDANTWDLEDYDV